MRSMFSATLVPLVDKRQMPEPQLPRPFGQREEVETAESGSPPDRISAGMPKADRSSSTPIACSWLSSPGNGTSALVV